MPYQIQPYNYQSTFVPTDLGVIQRGLEQRQGRYDSANQAWAQTKMALYDDPSYDPSVKEEVVKRVEGNFDNLYKSYNGDMGAAVGDLTQMIGGVRKDPYFAINKVALEKQKEYEALKKTYGAKGIEFKGMPKGLRDPNTGKLRSQDEFAPEVVQDLDRQGLASKIWEQSLEQVSREGGLRKSKDGKFYESVTTSGKGIFGQLDSKLPGVLNEYLQTPEGKLHMRIVMEKEGISDPSLAKGKIENWLKDIGQSRVAPESYSTDRISNPDYTSSVDNVQIPYGSLYETAAVTAKTSNNLFRDAETVVKYANKGDKSFEEKLAKEKINKVANSDAGRQYQEMIRVAAKRAGIDPTKILSNDGFLAGATKGGLPRNWNIEEVNKMSAGSKEDKAVLNAHIQKYNDLLREELKANDYQNFKWNTFDMGKAFDLGGTKLAGAVKSRGEATLQKVNDLGINQWIFEDSKLAGKKEYSEDEKKNFDVKSLYQGYDPATGNYALMVKTNDGEQHIVRPKSLEQAMHIARTSGDPYAIQAAATSGLEFTPKTVGILRNGVFEQIPLPKDVEIQEVEGGYFVKDKGYTVQNNGRPLTRYETAKYLNKYIKEPALEDK